MPGRKPASSLLAAKVGKVVTAEDELPASVVSDWTEDKHNFLQMYLALQAVVRPRWFARRNDVTYIDLFCGYGLSLIEGTSKFVPGSPVAAWQASREQGHPFTAMYIADLDEQAVRTCEIRLQALGAPVKAFHGTAVAAAGGLANELSEYGLHFAFLDPYSLGQLEFTIIQALAPFKHVDLLVHISAMDLFRNFGKNESGQQQQFELFAPGWKKHVDLKLPEHECRRKFLEYWQSLVAAFGLEVTAEMPAIKNEVNRHLYWLALLTRSTLAKKFWKEVQKYKRGSTGDMFAH